VILGFKQQPLGDSYFFGKVMGANRKFIRVIASALLPIGDRPKGVLIVLGEIFRESSPMNLIALSAKVGGWEEFEEALVKFRRDLKFDHLIVDSDEARHLIRRIPCLIYGEIHLAVHVAPKAAFSEASKQKVDSLVAAGRLHLDEIKHILDSESELGRSALRAAVCWASEHSALYGKAKGTEPVYERIFGTVGL
jgi:hypothetical protein